MSENNKIVVRIPPSPTGFFHVGRARTALFNYLYAKKNGGKIMFRLEDTDKERSKDEYVHDITDSLSWLGITYDEGPFKQSERTELYSKYIQKMLDNGTAYISQEVEGENKEVIRFKNPNRPVVFNDQIRGDISVDTTDLKDFIIARNINDPLYHLTVVVDDFEMGVTHIIRGDDGIANTPRQILIQEAIGAPRPIYAHVPLILSPDKSKMSARHGATSLKDFRMMGYLPEAMVNFLALLGFNPGGEQELFLMDELINVFDLQKVQKGGAVFNTEKLDWINKEYLKRISEQDRNNEIYLRLKNNPAVSGYEKIKDVDFVKKMTPIIFDRISKWGDLDEMVGAGELAYFFEVPEYDAEKLMWKEGDKETFKKHLENVVKMLEVCKPGDFETSESIKTIIFPYADQNGRGAVLWPLRVSLSGLSKSPDPFTLLSIFGKDESILRINNAIAKL